MGTLHPKVDVEVFEQVASLSGVSDLIIIGDGAQRNKVERLADDYDSVRATGRLPDEEAFELLGSASIAINPQTQSELQRSSSPVKLYYYAALGLPMVVAPGPTVVRELVERDAAVTADGSRMVANRVENLLSDDERRSALSGNAREAAESFQWTRRIDKFETVYLNTT
jgi:glycosyltransferase involved in cell wall biosynthesis